MPPARAEPLEVVLGDHARIAHKDAPAQFPPLQIVFDLGHGCDIHGIAREHPVAHRQAIAGHRQPDDDLRGIGAAIFRHPSFARRLIHKVAEKNGDISHQYLSGGKGADTVGEL